MRAYLWLVLLLSSLPAQAGTSNLSEEKRAEAREHYTNGTKKFNVAKFDEAAAEFVAAYEIAGEASLLYNIAQSYRMAEQHEKALFFFKSFLRQLDSRSPLRPEVEKRVAELTAAVAGAKRAATSPPTGTIRPEQLGHTETPPETTHPETTRPETTRPETTRPETTRPETTRPETTRPETTRPEITRPETPPQPSKPPSPALKWAGVALLGVGVVGIAVGAGMSAAAGHDSALLEQASQNGAAGKGVGFGPSLQSAQTNGPLYDTLSYVFYGIGGAAAVAGAVTLYLGLRKPAVEKRAKLSPIFSPSSAGLVVSGSFLKVVALVAAHNEADVIAQVIGDLIAQGVFAYLIDHGSTDGTVEAARPFLDQGLLGIERFPEESGSPKESAGRIALLERKEQLTQLLDGDWFLHSDADELRESPFPDRTLAEAIADVDRLGYNAIDFAVVNFAPTDNDFVAGADLRAHFAWYEPAPILDRLQIKCWKRAPVDLRSSGGNEARFAGRRVFPLRFLDRRYPVRTQGVLRTPSELRRFDPVETRRSLFETHRSAEAAEARARELEVVLKERVGDLATRERRVAEWQRDTLAARRMVDDTRQDLEATRRDLEATRRELEAARRYAEETQRDRESLRRTLGEVEATLRRELQRAHEEERRLEKQAAELRQRQAASQRELEGLIEELRGAEVRIDEIYASRTWRWTAPGRLLWRLLRR